MNESIELRLTKRYSSNSIETSDHLWSLVKFQILISKDGRKQAITQE